MCGKRFYDENMFFFKRTYHQLGFNSTFTIDNFFGDCPYRSNSWLSFIGYNFVNVEKFPVF